MEGSGYEHSCFQLRMDLKISDGEIDAHWNRCPNMAPDLIILEPK